MNEVEKALKEWTPIFERELETALEKMLAIQNMWQDQCPKHEPRWTWKFWRKKCCKHCGKELEGLK